MTTTKDLTLKQVDKPMQARIERMLQTTWETIASDWEQMHREMREPMTLASMAEGVGDANRYDQYGDDKEAADVYRRLPWKDMERIAKRALKRYR